MIEFKRKAVSPVLCFQEGWALIKDQLWLFMALTLVAILIAQVASIILLGPMMCGLQLCFLNRMRGEKVEFAQLFKGFDYFLPSFIAALIQMVPVLIASTIYIVPMMMFMFSLQTQAERGRPPEPDPALLAAMGVGGLIMMVVLLIVTTLFMFAFPLIVEHRLSGPDAIKTSAKAAAGNLGGLILLLLLSFVVGIVGMLLCGVGYFVALPLVFAAQAAAYRQVFPANQASFGNSPPPPDWNR